MPAEIQKIMGALVYQGSGLQASPYEYLLHERQLHSLANTFVRDACQVQGLSLNSPLDIWSAIVEFKS